jgi:hypothetical protein
MEVIPGAKNCRQAAWYFRQVTLQKSKNRKSGLSQNNEAAFSI